LQHAESIDLPNNAEDYVHRIGRTGRAGNEGEAMSLVCVDELGLLKDIERLIKREIPNVGIDGFEPDPSIKAEPIFKGRGKQQGSRKPGGKKKTFSRNSSSGKRPSSKGGSEKQGQSKKQAQRSPRRSPNGNR